MNPCIRVVDGQLDPVGRTELAHGDDDLVGHPGPRVVEIQESRCAVIFDSERTPRGLQVHGQFCGREVGGDYFGGLRPLYISLAIVYGRTYDIPLDHGIQALVGLVGAGPFAQAWPGAEVGVGVTLPCLP